MGSATKSARGPDERPDLALVDAFFGDLGLEALPFSREEVGAGKTPDRRIMRAGQLAAFCEVKSPRDDWLDEKLDDAAAFQIVGGARKDPIFNRLSSIVKKAVAQFDAANPERAVPNILFLVNHDDASHFGDLVEALTGRFHARDGRRFETMKRVSEGKIRGLKYRVDLYIWLDAKTGRAQGYVFSEASEAHVDALCSMLSLDKAKIRR